jgi:hypothetical protein
MEPQVAAWVGLLVLTLVNVGGALVRWLDADRVRRNGQIAAQNAATAARVCKQTSQLVQTLGMDVAATLVQTDATRGELAALTHHVNGVSESLNASKLALGMALGEAKEKQRAQDAAADTLAGGAGPNP